MAEYWSDPKTYFALGGLLVGVIGILWYHWNRRETRLDALGKVLQPMIRAAQLLYEMNNTRNKCEMLKRSYHTTEALAAEAAHNVGEMHKKYDELAKASHEQFRLTETEFASRSFRFPDRICKLVNAAFSSLSEFGALVDKGYFSEAELKFAKFRDDYGLIVRAGRGIRLADPLEALKRRFTRRERPKPQSSRYDISDADMKAILDMVHKRATTQAHNTFVVHPPQKIIANAEIVKSENVVEELEDSVFTVVFQDGDYRMMALHELLTFVYQLLFLRAQMEDISRMAQAIGAPSANVEVKQRFSIDEIMRPEMVKLLLGKVALSNVASDSLAESDSKSKKKTVPDQTKPSQSTSTACRDFPNAYCDASEQGDFNRAAYRGLRERINHDFPADRFVAISMGRIVADAASFSELKTLLHSMGLDSPEIMVVQSGVEYPEYLDIL